MTTSTRRPARTARAPYQVGDHVSALYLDPARGTCLARAARVVAVRRTDERAEYPWTITYRISDDVVRDVRVNAAGVDANRYVEPSTSVLTLEEAHTPAGQVATALAESLRRARVAGALATTTGGSNVAVVITWPSGNDRIVIGVDVEDGSPVFYVAAYEDREHEAPGHEHTARSIPAVVTEVVRLLATYTQNAAAEQDGPPWTAPDGLTLTLHHTDGTTTTAPVVALVDRDDVAGTVRVQTMTAEPGEGLAIVRRTYPFFFETRTTVYAEPDTPEQVGTGRWKFNGATVTGHEPVTGIAGPIRLHDRDER
ncbi:hypothetical protein ICW40_07440 [Actinotalea ferrariae]|uniref:hypothetical protein n=1 Tax=Actinotalea ferrariae TaxID=1386098 RepID=UPI001C8C446F|nr:hypothetical protein [Actinotalea ferrariae]MBX9244642.1 hypothetical protein [Actinotalea ferrariae]